jgi:2-alkenal reductase
MSVRRFLGIVLLLLAVGGAAVLGAVAGGAVVYRTLGGQPMVAAEVVAAPSAPAEAAANQLKFSSSDIETTITDAVAQVGPAVVTVVGVLPSGGGFFSGGGGQVSGSGVIISAEGYVLTNNHVVEGLDDLSVVLADGTQLAARLVGTDLYADLAVLQAEGALPSFATLGNSDLLKPGETVIAIGSPLGDFKNTVTVGVVSATGRVIDTGQGFQMEGLVQTDAAINSGNSGGPLVNLAGEVIGINTLVVRGNAGSGAAQGLGFSVPANTARLVADQIIANGYYARPYMGIRWQAITPDVAVAYNLPVQWGVFLTDVAQGSPADLGGLQQGDIIVKVGEMTLDAQHTFINALFNYKPGETVAVEVYRDGAQQTLSVTLGEAARSS